MEKKNLVVVGYGGMGGGYHAAKAIEKGVVGGYKAIESGVVGGYKAVESATVEAYKSVEDTAIHMGKSLMEEYNKQKSK